MIPQPEFAQQFATRYRGDTTGGPGPLHGDGSGHKGFRFTRGESVDVRIYRNGVRVAQSSSTPQAAPTPHQPADRSCCRSRWTGRSAQLARAPRSLTVEASFDQGRTSQYLAAARNGEQAVALVHHPYGNGFVSLRAAAADTAGNTVRETIIHAYRFG